MNKVQQQLITIIKSIVCGVPLPIGFSLEDPEEIYRLAKEHDVAHFVGYATEKGYVTLRDEKIRKAFQQKYYQVVWRITVIEDDIEKIKRTFEDSSIDFIPLKGAVLRGIYPEAWMRTSSDIDVLVHSETIKIAEHVLKEKLNYEITSNGAHHDHVTAPSGFHVDLHFVLTERDGKAKPYLDDVWSRCFLSHGKHHEYVMEDEMFYLFHMFHAATHFQLGGCGIRILLDTWLLNHKINFSKEKRKNILQASGLLQFAETIERISESWFSGAKVTGDEDIEDYILNGGLYGGKQRVAAAQAQHKNRLLYLVRRAFPPAKTMKVVGYQIVEKWKILLPFCWIHRLFRGFIEGKGRLIPYEVQKTKDEEEHSKEILVLFSKLGLS